ncbi:PREDICTED: stAR-related lipid transfer protein 3 [Nicrophorus vespilloides]|uniref:StAR-related lipid transfer protein 3 n=1 Tax=Nicrophorus vespilloides TaxID=110193 RepID=A0ABM1M4N5_NICVS|nr:PREDICTED: stAR-related lipid transfer protein 3 [Nicrophorus vespilloides]
MSEQDIRNAAEEMLRSNEYYTNQTAGDISHSHSINTITSVRPEYIISPEFFTGQALNGRMSSVRRFFCLFVTFDLLFTILMWLICIMLNGDNILSALSKQIYHYDVHTSLFDVILLAIFRFIVLLFFYAVLYVNSWVVIAISTATTCALLIAKVFVYDFQTTNQPVFQVLLVLISFVLSWGEAWFLDFRVIPREFDARQYVIASTDNERSPLIRNYVHGYPSMYTDSVANFYSPLGSREGSLQGFEAIPRLRKFPPIRLTDDQEKNYCDLGAKVLVESWEMLNSDEWKCIKEFHNDVIEVMELSKVGKIFKLTGVVKNTARCLLDELFYRVENIPKWNPALLDSHKVQTIDENTDICYQVSAEGARGAVSSRDFVTLRHWGLIEDTYLIACVATEHPSVPSNDKYIRGENGVGCLAMRPLKSDKDKSQFQWVFNTNLKGWLPQYILDTAYVSMMFDYIKNLRAYVEQSTNVKGT